MVVTENHCSSEQTQLLTLLLFLVLLIFLDKTFKPFLIQTQIFSNTTLGENLFHERNYFTFPHVLHDSET